MSPIAGQLITEALGYDEGRQLTVHFRPLRRRRSCSLLTVERSRVPTQCPR